MFKKFVATIFVLALSCTVFWGQTLKVFSAEQGKFLEELSTYLNVSNKKNKATYEKFAADLKSGRYTEDQFVKINGLASKMLEKRMRAKPYFTAYLECLNEMENKGYLGKQLDGWLNTLTSLITDLKKSQNKKYATFLQFCSELLSKNAIRYSKTGLTWTSTSSEFEFGYSAINPYVQIKNLDLIARRKKDSIVIQDTEGIYYPLKGIWRGKKGKANWKRAGLTDKVQCTFGSYMVETRKNTYKVDTVTFYHPTFFQGAITGQFEDKVIVLSGKNTGSYPRFTSFKKRIEVENIGDKIKYIGGFKLQGSSVIGFGDELYKARMDFYLQNDELALTTKADQFIIKRGEQIVAQNVEASVYFESDSIYHPSVDFKFLIPNRELQLARKGIGNSQIMFFNSFHQLEMDVEKIVWEIDTDSIQVGQAGLKNISNRPKTASFESLMYYNDRKYQRFQNIASYNPISVIAIYSEALNSNELDANELAKRFNKKLSLASIKGLLNDLVEAGFIFYDQENEYVIVKDKAIHYAKSSRKTIDFDVIRAISTSKETNGILDLTNQKLNLVGVKSVTLSDSQLVAVKPLNEELTFKYNRDMDFAGQLFAGYGIFWGKDFHFNYDEFLLDLDSVKRFLLRVPTGEFDKLKMPILTPLTNVIEDMNARIEIDENGNRSSREVYKQYPKLTSNGISKVYYDDKKTANGAYKRENFFFELRPFVFDSLDSFDPLDIKFEGSMVSAGIFPRFDEILRVQQKDLSLGFKTEAPPEGYPLYGGKGQYNDIIELSNKGLKGKGTIKYLTAVVNSDDILFLPKALEASTDLFNIAQATSPTEFPDVTGKDVKVDWRPYQDSMYIKSTANAPFEIFNGNYKLDGSMTLTPGGLYGSGLFDWKDASMTSKNFKFRVFGVDADTSNLSIKTIGVEGLAFNTKNVKSELDFKKKMGKFHSNKTGDINTEMPVTQYQTSMNEFVWDMDKKEIKFTSTGDKAEFVSTHIQQHSLKFEGSSANYNLETNLLKVEGVSSIRSADAFIYPKEEKVEIESNARMKPLENAIIIADTSNQYHTIKRATVTIEGKKSYKATGGFYEYNVGDVEQEIKFNSILVSRGKNKKLVTRGEGTLLEAENFLLDTKTGFKGKVKLDASQKELEFDGYAKIQSETLKDAQWFSINSNVDRKNVIIDYNEPRNENGRKLEAGIRIQRDSTEIYTLLLTPPQSTRDRLVFNTKGILKYDKSKDEFYFGDSLKILKGAATGNIVTFQNKTGRVITEGEYVMADRLKYIKTKVVGQGIAYHGIPKVEFDLAIGLEFLVPPKLLNMMIRDMETNNFDVPDVSYKEPYFKKAIAEFITNEKRLAKTYKELEEYEKLYLPKEVINQYTMFLGKVKMVWDPEVQSFLSTGRSLGVSYIGDKFINKQLKGHIEFRMTRQADEMNIYIESPGGAFYYFNYRTVKAEGIGSTAKGGILSVYSSNIDFNDAIIALKKKETTFKMDDGEMYEIKLTGKGGVNYFLRRANRVN